MSESREDQQRVWHYDITQFHILALENYIEELERENDVLTKNLDTATANIEDQADRIEELERRLRDVVKTPGRWRGPTMSDFDTHWNAEDSRLRDLLACIHRDGGHHTIEVGISQSQIDAENAWYKALSRIEELEREVEELSNG